MTDITAVEILERLRSDRYVEVWDVRRDAADLIEQQAEQIAGLTQYRDGYKDACKMYEQSRDASDSRAEQANAEAAALRKDLNASVAMHEQARLLANSALDERDLLRKVIEDAPHEGWCMTGAGGVYARMQGLPSKCDSWKSKALHEQEDR